jgi:hypothetical protein
MKEDDDTQDELSIFAGRKHLLSPQRPHSTAAESHPRRFESSTEYHSPRDSTFSEGQSRDTEEPRVAPAAGDLWTTEQLGTGYIDTSDDYPASSVDPLTHLQPAPVYPPNVAWVPQHPQHSRQGVDVSSPFQTNPAYTEMAHDAYAASSLQRLRTPPELELGHGGSAPQENVRYHDRWTSFMQNFGVVEGVDFRRRG